MFLKKSFLIILSSLMIFTLACQPKQDSKMLVESLQPSNSDEIEIFQIIDNIKTFISSSEWDKWLEMYSDDAVLTAGNKNVSKSEMRSIVEGISYKITSMEIINKDIGPNSASVSVKMTANDKFEFETYKFEKRSGRWLIIAENNP